MLFLQIAVGLCFLGVVLVLFFEKKDYLTYSITLTIVAAVLTSLLLPAEEAPGLENFILAIEWEVVFFLLSLFTIVEILEEEKIFQEVARRITQKAHTHTRKFFYLICTIGTLSAALIEDLSVAVIFIPMIVRACERLKINPTPFLLGMTISINLAATLTPFGSAQNILIASEFGLSAAWFLQYIGLYFLIGTVLTLVLLDKFVLSKQLNELWIPACTDDEGQPTGRVQDLEVTIEQPPIPKRVFNKNIIALFVFVVLLFVIPNILVGGFIGLLLFTFLNPKVGDDGKKRPRISHYLRKVDYKLIYFFMCLFILVYCMELNGTIAVIEHAVVTGFPKDVFLLALLILIVSSLLSGVLDNVPVTVIFIPFLSALVVDLNLNPNDAAAIYIAFIIGINVGGNFLPQGSAADMMTLELSKKFCVDGMNFKKLLKVGGLFALLHVVLGIVYIAALVFLFP